ncbi:hypothetical protein HOY82DRAFT_61082 [Tuber indicum]|nr:hypothetical protein HOY82DRAFT_61082 [Tuber indicum]
MALLYFSFYIFFTFCSTISLSSLKAGDLGLSLGAAVPEYRCRTVLVLVLQIRRGAICQGARGEPQQTGHRRGKGKKKKEKGRSREREGRSAIDRAEEVCGLCLS